MRRTADSLVFFGVTGKIALPAMEELLNQYMGKKIDVSVGTSAVYRGEVIDVRNGILYLRDEDGKVAHIAVDKIGVVYECTDSSSRPGFVS
jgi:hypothetical protein